MMNLLKSLLLLAFLSPGTGYYAQTKTNITISPGGSVGYTFGAGLSYGLHCNVGILNNEKNALEYGVSGTWDFSQVRFSCRSKHTHQMKSLNVFVAGQNFDAKIGVGILSNPAVYELKRRHCKRLGVNIAATGWSNNSNLPGVGFRTFIFNPYAWEWFGRPYKTIYTAYQYKFGKTEILNTLTN